MVLGNGGEVVKTGHVNDMTEWDEIRCNEHVGHSTRNILVDLSHPHSYHDYPQVPKRLTTFFNMDIWDWERYTGVTTYCPAHDAVSETIDTIGIWEPVETILALQVFSTATYDQGFVDCGAQIGWFSHLAMASNVPVVAFDADAECVGLLWNQSIDAYKCRFGVDHLETADPQGIRLLKMDLEGAEAAAIDAFIKPISQQLVDHILMEVSPCFNDGYADLLTGLIDTGYELYELPPKRIPPHRLHDPDRDLTVVPRERIADFVDSFDQADVWLKHENASW